MAKERLPHRSARTAQPASPPPRIRRSRASRWRAAVLIAVHVGILAHVAHWWLRGTTLSPLEPSEAMQLGKAGVVNAGTLFFALAIVSTALFGRFFCGWGCHLVALQDLCRWLLLKAGIRLRPLRSRLLLWVPAIAFCYMFMWPAAYRAWSGLPAPPVRAVLTTSRFWATFPSWGVAGLTFLVCGFVAVWVLGAKGFCTYACPYGAIFGGAARLAPIAIRVTDACCGAAHCTASCTSNVRVHEEVRDFGMVVNPGCMKCLDCVSVCPNDALYVGLGRPALLARPRRALPPARRRGAGWGEELLLASAFAGAFVTFRGLYGAVPFLLSLGIAVILAAVVLLLLRLARRPELWFGGFRLKHDGRVLPAGQLALGLALPLLLLWAHSAAVHFEAHHGESFYRRTAPLRRAALDLSRPLRAAAGSDLALVERARRHLERAGRWGLFREPGSDLRLAWMELLAGREEPFRRRIQAALAAEPASAEPCLLAGRELAARQRFHEAASAYARAIELRPRDPAGYLGLGTLLARRGELERARTVFEQGLAELPAEEDLLYNSGLASALEGNAEQAIERFKQALRADPNRLDARENLAGVLLGAGRAREAAAQLEIAIARSPHDAADRLLLARARLALGQQEQARAALEAALALDPGLAEARRLLAELGTGRRRTAIESRN